MGFFDFLNKKKIGVPEVYQNADFKDYKSYATIQDGKLLRLDVQKKATHQVSTEVKARVSPSNAEVSPSVGGQTRWEWEISYMHPDYAKILTQNPSFNDIAVSKLVEASGTQNPLTPTKIDFGEKVEQRLADKTMVMSSTLSGTLVTTFRDNRR